MASLLSKPALHERFIAAIGSGESTLRVFSVDPDAIDRGTNAHKNVQDQPADAVSARGWEPLSPSGADPLFDIGWVVADTAWIAEVKSLTESNEARQLRLGLGQVLSYAYLVDWGATAHRPVLAVERKPSAPHWPDLCASHGVKLSWPETFQATLDTCARHVARGFNLRFGGLACGDWRSRRSPDLCFLDRLTPRQYPVSPIWQRTRRPACTEHQTLPVRDPSEVVTPRAQSGPDLLDRFHDPVAADGRSRCFAAQSSPGSGLGIDGIGSASALHLTVRLHHLGGLDSRSGEIACQPRPIGTGAFHPHARQRPQLAQPRLQRPTACRARIERRHPQRPAGRVGRRSEMNILVGVDAAIDDDRPISHDEHLPFLSVTSQAPSAGTADRTVKAFIQGSYEITSARPVGARQQPGRPNRQIMKKAPKPVTPRVKPIHRDIERILPCRSPTQVDPSMSHPFEILALSSGTDSAQQHRIPSWKVRSGA